MVFGSWAVHELPIGNLPAIVPFINKYCIATQRFDVFLNILFQTAHGCKNTYDTENTDRDPKQRKEGPQFIGAELSKGHFETGSQNFEGFTHKSKIVHPESTVMKKEA